LPVDLVHRGHARAAVTTGLDPVVHPLRIKFFAKKMDCRVIRAVTPDFAGYARQSRAFTPVFAGYARQ
jgi:hypothetical protein